MRLLILFLLSTFTSIFCIAQNNNSIVGQWKLYAVMDDEYYHNFNNDSTSLSDYFKKQLIENKKDTIYAIQTIKEVVQVFKNSTFYFQKDSVYKCIIGFNSSTEVGTYSTDLKKNQIHTISNSKDVIKQKETYRYKLNYNKLDLTMQSENNDITFYLVRL